jgi:hypothetical protein
MYLLSEEHLAMVGLWRTARGGQFAPGPLPFAGGAADQPAIVMACFAEMDGAAALLRKRDEK